MKKTLIAVFVVHSILGIPAVAKDKLDCQSECYEDYRECTKDSQKAAKKLEKICKGDRECIEKSDVQAAQNNASCDVTLKQCTDECAQE